MSPYVCFNDIRLAGSLKLWGFSLHLKRMLSHFLDPCLFSTYSCNGQEGNVVSFCNAAPVPDNIIC